MTRYYVEFSSISNSYIIHREKCITYPGTQLGRLERMKDIGEHDDDMDALAAARRLYAEPCPCYCCFVKRYRKSVIAGCKPSYSRMAY